MLDSIADAAKFLKVSVGHVRRQIKAGIWPVYRFGQRVVRIDIDEIKKLSRVPRRTKVRRGRAR